MRRVLHCTAAAAALGFAGSGGLAAQQEETLGNGLRLVIVDRPDLPLVTFALYLRGGLLLDEPDCFRHGSLALGCLWMGHGDLDEEAVRAELGNIGAEYGSYVDLQDSRVHLSCLSQHAARGLELLAGATLQPAFAPDVVAREREHERRLIGQRRKQPEYLAQEAFVGAVVGDHALAGAYRLHGVDDALERADRAALVAAWRRMVQPQLATLFVVGRVPGELADAVRRRFSAWSPAATPTRAEVPPPQPARGGARVIKVPVPDMTQVYVQLGMLGPPLQADEAPAVHVLRLALAGGFTSSLEDELRVNRGLVYEISFSSPTLTFAPPYSLVTQTRPDKVGEVLDVTVRLLRAAADGGLRPEQIEAARNMWLGSRALERETHLGLAHALYRSLRLFGSFEGGASEAAAVRRTTPEEVADAAKSFDPTRFVVVLVGAPDALARIDWSLQR